MKGLSRQRRYQLRHQAEGLCHLCSEPAVASFRCLRHAIYHREFARTHRGAIRRNLESLTYRLERAAKGNQP
jgi:hypothetical protein